MRLKDGILRRVVGKPRELEDDVDVVILVVVDPVPRDAGGREHLQDELHELAAAHAEHLTPPVVAAAARDIRHSPQRRNLPPGVFLPNRDSKVLHRLGKKVGAQEPSACVRLARERREGREREPRGRRRAGVPEREAEHALGERRRLAAVAGVDVLDAHPLRVVVARHQVRAHAHELVRELPVADRVTPQRVHRGYRAVRHGIHARGGGGAA